MERCLVPRAPALLFAGALVFIAVLHGAGIVSADRVGGVLPFFCPFHAITGIPCPGCGMTRAMLSITKGDLHGALAYNPFSLFLLFMVTVSILPEGLIKRLPPGALRVMQVLFIIVLAALLVFWVIFRLAPALASW